MLNIEQEDEDAFVPGLVGAAVTPTRKWKPVPGKPGWVYIGAIQRRATTVKPEDIDYS